MDPLVASWSLDHIDCSIWLEEGDTAIVHGSNFAGDSCSFELIRVPGDEVALFDLVFDWRSTNWWESTLPQEVEKELKSAAERKLSAWESQVRKILSWLPSGQWKKGPGNDYQFEYAVLAFLKDSLSEYGGLKTNTAVSRLLDIPVSTVVERIRECRNRGLLTIPGKGIRGHSVMTTKARKLLIEKGVIGA